MAQRRHHYDAAFESYLRARRLPYVSVDEARRALLPEGARLRLERPSEGDGVGIKSFDFIVYGGASNLIVDVKGRKVPGSSRGLSRRLESWVTQEDVASLAVWEQLFGDQFSACFAFLYWCESQPPDGLFQEVYTYRERWYALRSVRLSDYAVHMVQRSARWKTVHLPIEAFAKFSRPFSQEIPEGTAV
ncbi:MAG: HYExAFE family protein [Planctomycetota bacterium]